MACIMRIYIGLPKKLQPEYTIAACYILQRLLIQRKGQKTPFKLVIGRIPNVSYIVIYGCLAYVYIYSLLALGRTNKLSKRTKIRYLVSYDSINIYRVQDLSKDRVLRVKDVLFNKTTFYNLSILTTRFTTLIEYVVPIAEPTKEPKQYYDLYLAYYEANYTLQAEGVNKQVLPPIYPMSNQRLIGAEPYQLEYRTLAAFNTSSSFVPSNQPTLNNILAVQGLLDQPKSGVFVLANKSARNTVNNNNALSIDSTTAIDNYYINTLSNEIIDALTAEDRKELINRPNNALPQ